MGIFGWSYPPGCSGPPEDYMGPCEGCGGSVDNCICPECPVCGECGKPACYGESKDGENNHGMVRTIDQTHRLALLEESYRQQAAADRAEGEYWTDPQREVEAAEFAELMHQEAKDGR